MDKSVNEFEIRRLDGSDLEAFGDANVYEILDDESLEGVYYLIVDPDKSTVTLTSINSEGDLNQSDNLIFKSKLPTEPEETPMGLVWTGDLSQILTGLIGAHSAIIIQDIRNNATDNVSSDWEKAITGALEQPTNSSLADLDTALADIGPFSFDFDPDLNKQSSDTQGAGDPESEFSDYTPDREIGNPMSLDEPPSIGDEEPPTDKNPDEDEDETK